jgi:hypothetical protein
VRKDIPHNHVDLPPLASVEASGVSILICNSEVLLAAVCKSPGHAWNDADIIKLLSFRHKLLLAGDLNAKYPFWNSGFPTLQAPNYLIYCIRINEFEISASQCPTHFSSARNGDELDIVMHKNVQLSEVIVSDTLDSDHLQSFSTY